VLEEYAAFVNTRGLNFRGLCQCYYDGISDIARDYAAVGLGATADRSSSGRPKDNGARSAIEALSHGERGTVASPFKDRTNTICSPAYSAADTRPCIRPAAKPQSPLRKTDHLLSSAEQNCSTGTRVCIIS
jgi:hypothetical protein